MKRFGNSFYRDKANGKMMGVCAGIAGYFGFNVMWVRIMFFFFTVFTGFFPGLFGYFVLGLILNDKPPSAEETRRVNAAKNISGDLDKIEAQLRETDRQLTGIEAYITSDEFELQRKIWNLNE
ncbi:MAG: envelope stress response membrane protein PspC [Gammaproteobacteria bacterium]|nr:envelope stress response membrane protein PspC [Gammaproteobacteria bacterium]